MSNVCNQIIVASTSFLDMLVRTKNSNIYDIHFDKFSNIKLHSIYLGKIIEKNSALKCFFVRLNNSNSAMLKFHKNNQQFTVGQKIIVQIVKEDTKPNKLAVVTDAVVIRGALALYLPKSSNIIFSVKKTSQEVQNITEAIGDTQGIVVRSLYKHSLLKDLCTEVQELKQQWAHLQTVQTCGLLKEYDVVESMILENSSLVPQEILCDDYKRLKQIKKIADKYSFLNISIKNYDISNFPISDITELQAQKLLITPSLEFVFYEQEAFNYIDVNFKGEPTIFTAEDIAYKTNLSILPSIAQQIIARNLSGMILIDLLKITNKQYKLNILNNLKALLLIDTNKVTVLGFSNLGLLEVSRQKLTDSLNIKTQDEIKYSLYLLLIKLKQHIVKNFNKKFILCVNTSTFKILNKIATVDIEEINSKVANKIELQVDELYKEPEIKEIH